MARNPDVSRRDQDEPIEFGRSIIAGTVAGLIACFGYVKLHDNSDYSMASWRDRAPQGPARQLESPVDSAPRNGEQAPDLEEQRDPSGARFVPPEGEPSGSEERDPAGVDYSSPNDREPPR